MWTLDLSVAHRPEGQNQVSADPLWVPVLAPQSLAALGPEWREHQPSLSRKIEGGQQRFPSPFCAESTGSGLCFLGLPPKVATLNDIFLVPERISLASHLDMSDSLGPVPF